MKIFALFALLILTSCSSKVGYHPQVTNNVSQEKYESDRQYCMKFATYQVGENNNALIGGVFGVVGSAISASSQSETLEERNKKLISFIDQCMTAKGYDVIKDKD